jgi:hypothetical protein
MRPLLSYDDISAPPQPLVGPQIPMTQGESEPPSKKRKQSNQNRKNSTPLQHPQHWDDHNDQDHRMDYGGDGIDSIEASDDGDGESGELTYEEIWDDSALVDAWNAATEEYEVFL